MNEQTMSRDAAELLHSDGVTGAIPASDQALVERLLAALGETVIGQRPMLEGLLIGLLANGHVLLEGVPGIAKTLAVTTLAQALRADYQRIQFTPDLLPADLVGTLIYQPGTSEFRVRKGPIFANLLLADEINRAPAKVQSALLEAMQEGQVTIGEESFLLPQPFLVLATQNPLEHDGTYPLPEAQVDRFMLKLKVGYPERAEELQILDKMAHNRPLPKLEPVADLADVRHLRRGVDEVYLDDKIKRYIVDLVFATRDPAAAGLGMAEQIEVGASPRASIYLALAAKAHAFIHGRSYVTPHDIKAVGMDVLRHRLMTSYAAEAMGVTSEDLLRQIFDHVPVP
jgi:MoxR-like ATPase